MASTLNNMLSDLAKNPSLLDEFKADPDSVMDKYGVADDEKAMIHNAVSNNQNDLLQTLGNVASATDSDGPEPTFAC